MMAETKIAWAHCNRCNGSTQHDILHFEQVILDDEIGEGFSVTYWDDYTLLKCRGCDTVHLKHESAFSEDVGPDGNPEVTTTIYPPRVSRNKPNWLSAIDGPFWAGKSEIEQLLEEIYAALHNNSLRLAAMGVRALLEFIMIDKVGDRGSIGENIKAFLDGGYVAPIDQE